MKPSFLINNRIYLRAVEPEDIDVMYQMENDPAMWDIGSFTVPYSRYALRQYIEGSKNDLFADKQLRLMIVDREAKQTLGTIDITDFAPLHSRAAVGIAINQQYRNQRYAADALHLLCEYAFGFLFIKQLYAHIPVDNEASRRLFSSCGFVQCGLLKDWLVTNQGYKDTILMQYLNPKG